MFPTLDANANYWQIELDKDAKDKKAFVPYHRSFKYKQMQFHLKIASATFQSAMNVIIATTKWKYAIAYSEDVFLFFQMPSQRI